MNTARLTPATSHHLTSQPRMAKEEISGRHRRAHLQQEAARVAEMTAGCSPKTSVGCTPEGARELDARCLYPDVELGSSPPRDGGAGVL